MARGIINLALLLTVGATGAVSAAPPGQKPTDFFEQHVRPLLIRRCYECHSEQLKKPRGGLVLDSKDGWLKGGSRGPAIVPGNPDESLLIQAVRFEDEDLQMPPKGKLSQGKLSQREILLLTQWVTMGAPGPRTNEARPPAWARPDIGIERGREFWAFRPPVDPPIPAVRDRSWTNSALDRFVLAALEANGLRPSPPADKRTLIRRATFDLSGLPPTLEEIDAFLADDSADAFARVVDRLLTSPHYGEHWGRHWLDVARFADSNGLDENVAYGNAWRYRDYVIASFNSDKQYDQFVLEQLAGDLLTVGDSLAERHERLIATGFLALGPKVLAEPDERKMEMDIVDEQVDTVGRAFMGLTLGCARCHDHKFDPISTADYYGVAGIFKSTRTMENFKKVARWYENPLATAQDLARKAGHDQEVAAKTKAIQDLVKSASERLRAERGDGFKLLKMPETVFPQGTKSELKRLRDGLAALEKSAPEVTSAMGVSEGKVGDTYIHVRGSHMTPGPLVPRRVPRVLATSTPPHFGTAQSGRLELGRWLINENHPLTSRVIVNRIWRWHFGRGLVSTPDNFGEIGDRPHNQPLLDWLALRLVNGGWSIKAIHRVIMLSSTYQMGSDASSRAARIDPENRSMWRMDVRRLEAEAIRDALLFVAGTLDRTIKGSLLTVKNRDYFFDHTSHDTTKYDSPRRSVYLPVVRNHLYDMFQLFDSSDASVTTGDRATTTIAPQALFMMNSDLVLQAARDTAAGLLGRRELDTAGRISLLYEKAYGRLPSSAESGRAAADLKRFEDALAAENEGADETARRLGAWQALCQMILASNEFIYIR
jgi:hypothetical protein